MSITLDALRAHDPSNMYSAIRNFPTQIREGLDIGRASNLPDLDGIRRVVILGMGGSAIGGDLLRSYLSGFPDRTAVDVLISRGYVPPPVDGNTLLIASSYSGNTEETIEAYGASRGMAGSVLVITTGGTLARMADEHGDLRITLPGGLQPRAALAYSFFPLLSLLAIRCGHFGDSVRSDAERGSTEAPELLDMLGDAFGAGPVADNESYAIATALRGTVPVIYSALDRLEAVNLRWRGQIQENAKHLAFGNMLPEMNHNEINGWLQPEDLTRRFTPVFLHDGDDHPQVRRRLRVTERIIGEHSGKTLHVASRGESLLARMFSLVHLGDWVSWYLAALNDTDPMPVPVIEGLKKELAAAGTA